MMNRRGTASDVVFAGVLLFSLAVGIFIIGFIGDRVSSAMQNTTAFNESGEASAVMAGTTGHLNAEMDYVVFAVFIGLVLTVLITSWFIGANPLFFIVYFIVLVIGIVISAILSNAWEAISTNAEMTSYLAYLPITNHLLTYLPMYVAGLGLLGMIIMFAKPYIGRPGGEVGV